MPDVSEKNESLWILTASPIIWTAHFLLSYITAAIWCEKVAGYGGPLGTVRVIIAVYTAIALIGIGVFLWRGYRMYCHGRGTVPPDRDLPESRHRFLGLATLLLSALSAVAVLYEALAAVFMGRCY